MSDPSLPASPLDLCPRCSAPLVAGMVICPDCEIPIVDLQSAATGPLDPRRQGPTSFDSGQTLGERYTVVERVGAGGMGLIYKALDRKLGRSVALKLIQAGLAERPGARERFRREILLAQQVTHPNVCRVHDLGEFDGQPFISMEYVEGQTLETLIQSMGHLSPSQTVALAKQVCAGLSAIHQRGIVHRDLKPSNVMVDRLGHVVLMDFGMAYHEDQERLTQAGAVFGTLAYLAPEQARGRPEARSDIYALGLILYEMLAGRRPPGDDDALPLALRDKAEPCPPPSQFSPEVPEALDQLVLRCLEREPERRYASASELGQALQQFEGQLTRSGLVTREARPPAPVRHRSMLLAGLAAALIGLAVFAIAGWRRTATPPGPQAVAFLPLAYSGPPEEAYLKDLLPLVLSQELQRTPGLTVTPFSVSRTFGAQEDPRAVARQLGVSLVVMGTTSSSDARTRTVGWRAVTAAGQQSWALRQTGTATTLLQQTPETAREMARSAGLPPRPVGPTRSAEALKHYLEGTSLLEGWDSASNAAKAIAAFRAALAVSGDFPEAEAGLSRAILDLYWDGNRSPSSVEDARSAAERAALAAPELPEAQLALGLVHLARGRTPEATAALEKALQLAPANDLICSTIAKAYERSGRSAEAEQMFLRATELRAGYWSNHNALGAFYLRAGRMPQAELAFRRVIELSPERDIGYSNLGSVLLMSGRPAEAEPILSAALKIHPLPEVRSNLAFVYYSTGRFGEAAEQWGQAVAAGTQQPEVFNNLADALRQLGRHAEARHNYSRALTLWEQQLAVNRSDAIAHAGMAIALAGLGTCPEALQATRRALSAPVNRGPAVDYYAAVVQALCGRREAAVASALKAIQGGAGADIQTNPDLSLVARDERVRRLLRPPADHSQGGTEGRGSRQEK